MADGEGRVDDCAKLLDNGWAIVLWKNDLGSYSAVAVQPQELPSLENVPERYVTDDFTPAKALYRLTEKVTTGRIVGS